MIFSVFLCFQNAPSATATHGCNAIGWDYERHADVQGCSLYYPAISWLYENGYAEGEPGEILGHMNYNPQRPINRAEFTKLVLLASGKKNPTPCISDPFPDVPKGEWYAPYICSAKELGIISGFPDGTFKPATNVNFANGSKILARSFDLEIDPSDDQFGLGQNVWYRKYSQALLNKKAVAPTTKAFDQLISRGEMAEMLYRLRTGKTSQDTPVEGDANGLGTGLTQLLFDSYGFYMSSGIKHPFVVETSFTNLLGRISGANGENIFHVVQNEHCDASGLWEHCKPLMRDWSVRFYRINTPSDDLIKQVLIEGEIETLLFGGKEGKCSTYGVEGEYLQICIVPLIDSGTLVVEHEYVDSDVAFFDVLDVTPKAEIDRIFRLNGKFWGLETT